jgi:aminopeptidase 2
MAVLTLKSQTVGYPVVHVTEDDSTGTITITQHRYLQDGPASPEDDKVLYPLNLRIRTKEGVDDNINLYDRTSSIKVPIEFFKLNADHYGFYRVLYTPKRLQILGQNAKDGLLSPEDKIGLMSDALSMAGSDRAKTSSVLSILEDFDEETNFFVWKQVLDNLQLITGAWNFEDKQVKDALKFFRTRLVSKCLNKKGWEFKDGEDKVEQMFKALLFSNSGEDPKVLKAAHTMFDAFLASDPKAININIQEAVFSIVLEHGGVEEVSRFIPSSYFIHAYNPLVRRNSESSQNHDQYRQAGYVSQRSWLRVSTRTHRANS